MMFDFPMGKKAMFQIWGQERSPVSTDGATTLRGNHDLDPKSWKKSSG